VLNRSPCALDRLGRAGDDVLRVCKEERWKRARVKLIDVGIARRSCS